MRMRIFIWKAGKDLRRRGLDDSDGDRLKHSINVLEWGYLASNEISRNPIPSTHIV